MSTKISGDTGIDVAQLRPADGDPVAITIAADGKVAFPQNARSWKPKTIANAVSYTNNTGLDIELAIICTSGSGTAIMALAVSGITIAHAFVVQNQQTGMLTGTVPPGASFNVGDIQGVPTSLTCNILLAGPVTGVA